jgi:hypothetical protein
VSVDHGAENSVMPIPLGMAEAPHFAATPPQFAPVVTNARGGG